MYDWSSHCQLSCRLQVSFQLLLKGCTIEAHIVIVGFLFFSSVSVVVERMYDWSRQTRCTHTANGVSVVVERMYDWSLRYLNAGNIEKMVSVVVERMYDWSSETNWLKTNDFWQLVSDLFFENGRSAQKVPLFSKIWGDLGDCLTVFDSCSNI